MTGVLFPAYQKLYSALSSLDRFSKENNFFDNVSCLDVFFSEFRNITFAIQKEVKNTERESIYLKNRDKYLIDHWFVDKRNETTKEQPFRLIKKIKLTLYYPYRGFSIKEKEYSVENDEPFDYLLSEIKKIFSDIKETEIFFSVVFAFREAESDIDLIDKISSGIESMLQFMDAMDRDIGEECSLCNQLKEQIKRMKFANMPRDMFLINDYVYYPLNKQFERAERTSLAMLPSKKTVANHHPLAALTQSKYLNYDNSPFGNFTLMHAILRIGNPEMDIMPAIMIVYEDETYDLDVFASDIKTTFYRKINETARIIHSQNVREVCYISLYSVLSEENHKIPLYAKERIAMSSEDILVCASVDNQLHEREYVFDGKKMEQPQYIISVLKHGQKNTLELSQVNMFPIKLAFMEKKAIGEL